MRKKICLLLALTMLITLTSCKNNDKNNVSSSFIENNSSEIVSDNNNNIAIDNAFKQIMESGYKVSNFSGTGTFGDINSINNNTSYGMPNGLAIDKDKNLYICDTYNNLIRKITDDKVSTFSGNVIARDIYGFADSFSRDGDNLKAFYNRPNYIKVTDENIVVVSDTNNHAIRVSNDKITATLVGGKKGYKNANGTDAMFNEPTGIELIDNDNMYIADTGNNCIRKVDTNGNVTLYAGTPEKSGYKDGKLTEAIFNEPIGLALDSEGTLYVADSGNQRIRKIKDGIVSTIAGGGNNTLIDTDYFLGGYVDDTANKARFHFPSGIELMDDNTLIIADTNNHAIRKIDLTTLAVTTVAGNSDVGSINGEGKNSTFHYPTDVLNVDGKILVADSYNNLIRIIER